MNQTDAMSAERRDLIIDFGGVITYSLFERCRDIEQLYRLPDGSLDWTGPFNSPSDELWQQYLSGQISERDYWYIRCGELGQLLKEEITIRRLVTDLRNFKPSVRPEAETLIRQAHAQGHRVGLLTNELELFHGPEVYDAFEILGMVLGEIIEAKLRTSMARVETPLDFVNRPVSATIAVIIVLALTAHVWTEIRNYRQRRTKTPPSA